MAVALSVVWFDNHTSDDTYLADDSGRVNPAEIDFYLMDKNTKKQSKTQAEASAEAGVKRPRKKVASPKKKVVRKKKVATTKATKNKAKVESKSRNALDARERIFIVEYLNDLNPRRAALAAGYSKTIATTKAYSWVSNGKLKPKVYDAVQKALAAREERTQITSDMVLQRWWQMATADANELVQFRRDCCRYCHGENHEYQWVDEAEYAKAYASAEKSAEENNSLAHLPESKGGFGYSEHEDPHPDCPRCGGEGLGRPYFRDTRDLSPAAQSIYAGIKVSKEGMQVLMHDQAKSLENVAKHLGMLNQKLDIGTQEGDPIRDLIGAVTGKTLRPSDE